MPSQAGMRRRIEGTEDLQSVVTTMKSLAAVNIRQYEQAAAAVDEFYRTVQLGLRVVLPAFGADLAVPSQTGQGPAVAVVLGSDQGMCGRFNEDVVRFAEENLNSMAGRDGWHVLCMGQRIAAALGQAEWGVDTTIDVPGAAGGINAAVQDLLFAVGDAGSPSRVVIVYNRHLSGVTYEPTLERLLPLDRDWIQSVVQTPWETNELPTFRTDPERLFAFLVRQYLFVSLYRAVAHSLAGENASRLAAMQAAEKNIDERLAELRTQYHQTRQSSITAELLDIVSGFQVLSG